jgi:hypothetical protein
MRKKHKATQFEMGFAGEVFNLIGEPLKVPVCRHCGRWVEGLRCGCEDLKRASEETPVLLNDFPRP